MGNKPGNPKICTFQQKVCIDIENNIDNNTDQIKELLNIISCINHNNIKWNINDLSSNTKLYTTDLYNYDIRIILFDLLTDQKQYLIRMINLRTLRTNSKFRAKIQIPLTLIHNKQILDIIETFCEYEAILSDVNIIYIKPIIHKLINRNSFLSNIIRRND
jgi:hypothetical protein